MAVGPLVQSLPPYPTRAGVLTSRVDTGRPERTCCVDTVRGRLSPTAILAMVAAAVFLTVANTSASAVSNHHCRNLRCRPSRCRVGRLRYSVNVAVAHRPLREAGHPFRFGKNPPRSGSSSWHSGRWCGRGANLPVVIAARVIQGAGSGAIPTLSVAILADQVPSPRSASSRTGSSRRWWASPRHLDR